MTQKPKYDYDILLNEVIGHLDILIYWEKYVVWEPPYKCDMFSKSRYNIKKKYVFHKMTINWLPRHSHIPPSQYSCQHQQVTGHTSWKKKLNISILYFHNDNGTNTPRYMIFNFPWIFWCIKILFNIPMIRAKELLWWNLQCLNSSGSSKRVKSCDQNCQQRLAAAVAMFYFVNLYINICSCIFVFVYLYLCFF